MALRYDANDRSIYPDGVTHDDVRDAMQAAALADDLQLSDEIARRNGWDSVCRKCAVEPATTTFELRTAVHDEILLEDIPVCDVCKEILAPSFADIKIYMRGLITRDVQ